MLEKKKPLELEEDELDNVYGGVVQPVVQAFVAGEGWRFPDCGIIVPAGQDRCYICGRTK